MFSMELTVSRRVALQRLASFPFVSGELTAPTLELSSGEEVGRNRPSLRRVRAGAAVREGQQIALSGNTKALGETVGPHLHIAVVATTENTAPMGSASSDARTLSRTLADLVCKKR